MLGRGTGRRAGGQGPCQRTRVISSGVKRTDSAAGCACAASVANIRTSAIASRMSCIVGEKMTPTPPRSLVELFIGFLSIGARSFGGVMPWAHRAMVEERRWLTPEDFAETVGLCQFLPGPNIGNASIVLGKRWFGVKGAIVAFLGLFALPFVWVLVLASLYADFGTHHLVRAVVTGIGAAAAGLFIGTAVKLGRSLARRPAGLVLVAACFAAIALFRVSLFVVLPVAAVIAFALAWTRRL